MLIALHKEARTTPAVRAEIAASLDPVSALAQRYNVTEATIRKWRSHSEFHGKPPAHPPTQSGVNQVLTGSRSGNSSSIRLFRQVGSFSRVSRSHAAGSRPLRRAVPSRV